MIFDYKLVHKGAKYYKIDSTKIARRTQYPVAIVKCQTICEVASSTVFYNSALKVREHLWVLILPKIFLLVSMKALD
jgi:hypothetical protein